MSEYDLTTKIIPFLDRHLAFPLLTFLVENEIFPADQLTRAQYELAKETNMVDFTAGLYEQIYPDQAVPPELEKQKQTAMETHERLSNEAQIVLDVIENPEVVQALRQDKLQNLNYLKEHYNVTLKQIEALYNFGQFQYTYGNYTGAADYLYHFRILSTENNLLLSAQWGKVASDILSGRWETALEELNRLKDLIENGPAPSAGVAAATGAPGSAALNQLQSRTWLLHWSLFVYFNHPEGRTALLETFLTPNYLNTLQISCPWLLRYLAAASIIARKGSGTVSRTVRTSLQAVVKLIQAEEYQYTDPVTTFLKDVYVDFDFAQAQKSLKEAEKVLEHDFFLEGFKDEFLENARFVVSEAYCRIHQRIDIGDLSQRLNLSATEGEKWIVNLIRDSDSRSTTLPGDAKIDLEQNVISTSKPTVPVYQTIIEKTKGLAFRTQVLGAAMAKRSIGDPGDGTQEQQPQQQSGGKKRGGGGGHKQPQMVAAEA